MDVERRPRYAPGVHRSIVWVAVGVVAMVGGLTLGLRGAIALQLPLESLTTILVACALGAAAAGAVIVRHAATRPAHEILISAATSLVIVLGMAFAIRGTRSFTEVLVVLSPIALVAVGASVLAAAALGASLARRVPASEPSTPLLLLASGLLTMGTTMLLLFVATAIVGTRSPSGWSAILMLVAVASGTFLAQAIAPVRRPWVCGCGGLLLMLLVLQEGDGDVLLAATSFGFLTLIGTVGARIAGRVFARRFAAQPSALPAARVE